MKLTRFRYLNWVLTFFLLAFAATAPADPKIWIPGWQTSSPMSTARAGSAVLEHNGTIYAIGGIDGRNFLATVEFAKISSDGSLSAWQTTAPLNEPRGFFDAVIHDGFIYVVGGGNGPAGHNLLRSVERAKINSDGSLDAWRPLEAQLNMPRRCVKLAVVKNRLYAFGGFGGTLLDTIESAEIQSGGKMSAWRIEDIRALIEEAGT